MRHMANLGMCVFFKLRLDITAEFAFLLQIPLNP